MSDRKKFGLLREAPKPRLKEIPADEAVDIAKKAFYEARRAQLELMTHGTAPLLFKPDAVGYDRLRMLRGAARDQVKKAQMVSQLLDDAIEAFEATVPRVKP